MRYLLIFLFAGCAAVTVPPDGNDEDSPICKVPEHRFMEVNTSYMRYVWTKRFGPLPERCQVAEFQVIIAESEDEYFGVCPENSRACQGMCQEKYIGIINPNFVHDFDLVPHEYCHALDHCVNDNVDYFHEKEEFWGPEGFVMEFLPK